MADNNTNKTAQAVGETLKSLGVARSFFDELLTKGDDWSFVIKIHALLEAALTHLLASELERPELTDILSKIETSDKRAGKVAFVKALKLLDEDHRRFINALSELRNVLVHDIRNTSFSFAGPLFALGQEASSEVQKKSEKCVSDAAAFFKESFELVEGKPVTRKKFAKENPRFAVYFAVFFTLGNIYAELGAGDPLVRALMKMRRRQPNPPMQPTAGSGG